MHTALLKGRTLMITGGTGSFGNAALRRFLGSELAEIRVFSRDEKKQHDMRLALGDDARSRVQFLIGDVRSPESLLEATRGVDFIFHAAALKQVPSCEFFPMEALRTNVIGTENVLNAAAANRVARVVVLSTDKAVYPINVMGLSKALAEKLTIAKARTISETTTVCVTRYGNVMNSRGSVIPLFISQLLKGQPLTITDPTMTRFLMSLESAVDLVLHAFTVAKGGEIFVQKAPGCTIETLAASLQVIFEKRGEIRVMGPRHGEKMHETLVSREEMVRAEADSLYFRIPSDARDLNYARYLSDGYQDLAKAGDFTSENTIRLDIAATCELLVAAGVRRASFLAEDGAI